MESEQAQRLGRVVQAAAIIAYGVIALDELDKACAGDPQMRNVQALIAAPFAAMFLRLADAVAAGRTESTEEGQV